MFMLRKTLCSLCLLLCTAVIFAHSLAEAEAAARDAADRMDALLNGRTGGTGTNQASAPAQDPSAEKRNTPQAAEPVQSAKGGTEPAWVNDPYRAYNRDRYIAAVGFADNRADAEKKALAALTAVFGQSIQSDFFTVSMYSEAVSKGVITVSENTRIQDTVIAAASLDTLIGAEIGNVWDSGKGIIYAAACMDREKTVAIYTELININLKNIEKLTIMNAVEKNSFHGYARYKLAALIAGLNTKYLNVISQAGNAATVATFNLVNADYYNLEALNIYKNITVLVDVTGDHSNRIRDTFAKALSGEGLRTQGNGSPYKLEVKINMNEDTSFPDNRSKFCRYTVSANLLEYATGAVLIPFTFTDRVGANTYARAESVAINEMEKNIQGKYPAALKAYFENLLPQN
jgi:hypothetical protein